MEAVPKIPLISFELKGCSENTQFGPKLKQYIAEAYKEDPDSYNNEIHQLEGLRSAAVRPSSDAAGLNALIRYFCQLRALQSRFPMAKGQPVACSFSWKDLYSNMSCSQADVHVEMASILYNIGALFTQLGASEPRTTPDSMKAACTNYQNAAWAFQVVREQYPQPQGVDISTDIMRLFQEICFGQAQECILEKSIQDTRKPSVVGAVATQVLHFYKNSLGLLGSSTGTDNIHEVIGTKLYNYWHRCLSFKSSYIGCIVCLYQGMNSEEQQKMGERVAFYQLAVDKLGEASKLAKYIEPTQVTQDALTFTNDVVEGKRKAAKNENEFIYHEEVPDKDLLMDLKPVCLVKALPLNLNDPQISGPDLFARLVPMVAHEASSVYSEEKAKLLRQVVSRVELKNTEFTEFMSSLQLDQLDILDSDQKIPQEIVDRCAAMNAKSDVIQLLVDSMNNLAEIISDVEHSLTEIKDIIQEESAKEKEYQKVMGPRPPSIVQTELSREYHKYLEAHNRTNESNQVLHKAMTLHIANLRLLAQPLDILQTKIPSVDNIEGLDRDTMLEMRRVVSKAREMQTQRDALIQQLREAVTNDDITGQLLARDSEPRDEIYKQELEKHTPTVKIIDQNLSAQENIINKLTSLYASYGESRRLLADVLRKREALINALVTSYDTHEELLGKSQKGVEFYRKLSHNVGQLLVRLRSTCQVQREEREQLLANHHGKAPTSVPASVPKMSEVTPSLTGEKTALKLKDYLPYMKNRGAARSVTPQAPVEHLPLDTYYPESIYPTSVRPTPVGSEATDVAQMQLPDGVVNSTMQNPHNPHNPHNPRDPYNRYAAPYAPSEIDPYSTSLKSYDKPEDMHHSYHPGQYPNQIGSTQSYSSPYYSGSVDHGTINSDSINSAYVSNQANMNLNASQYGVYNDPYHTAANACQLGYPDTQSSVPGYGAIQSDLNVNFAQMQISVPKSESFDPKANFGQDYSQNYYNTQYPPSSTPSIQYSQVTSSCVQYPQSSTPSVPYPQTITPNVQNPQAEVPNVQYPLANTPNVQYTEANTPSAQYSEANTQFYPQSVPYPQANISNAQYHQAGMPSVQYSQANNFSLQYPQDNPSNFQYDQGVQNYNKGQSSISNVPSLTPSEFCAVYSDGNQYSQPDKNVTSNYGVPEALQYSYATTTTFDNSSQVYTTYTSADSTVSYATTNTANMLPNTTDYTAYNPDKVDPQAVAQIDSFDTHIKSHVTGEALSSTLAFSTYQNYNENTINHSSTIEKNVQPNAYADQSNQSSLSYQNHPGYTFNSGTGNYDYAYGSQNSYASYANVNSQPLGQDKWPVQGVYTSAGICETLQSPSEGPQTDPLATLDQTTNSQVYYNSPYGYQTNEQSSMQPVEVVYDSQPASTNYGANMNQSTYMQSGQLRDTNVTYSNNNQVSTSKNDNNLEQPPNETMIDTEKILKTPETIPEDKKEIPKPEPTTYDLLSGIDFSVEQTPLIPEIKVPPISESAIKKPVQMPKTNPVTKPVSKEEVIERPAKRDLFSDPSLLNKFTQEVKNLQKLVDSLTNKSSSGLTVLDSKWKTFQEVQAKENMIRSKSVAIKHTDGNVVTEVVPYDDSRLTLKSDPDVYLNATYYKQLASWCIPLVISKNPEENEYCKFWRAMLENKISCVVCLLSEIEMQGNAYWPTAIGQSLELTDNVKVTLDEVICTVHWTERKLTVACGKAAQRIVHYQINVFPAKIVCSPLVMLVDKVLQQTYEGRLSNQLCGACVQCGAGAGRSAVFATLLVAACQLRAGQLGLCETMDATLSNLYKHRSNVLEDTRYLADAYRTVLFYVQGVLCSGTTMFNGEAVSVPTGASILPRVPTPPNSLSSQVPPSSTKIQKFSRESFEEMKQSPGLKSGDMKDPLNFLDPLWSLKKK